MSREFESNTESLPPGMRESDDPPPIDVGTAVAALAFNSVALPPNLPEAVKRLIEEAAEREREATGPANANPLAVDSRVRRDEEERKNDAGRMMDVIEEVQRQREEWARTTHSFGNTTMTGAEWQTMSDELREGGELRTWLLARIIADGHTRAEAEHIADRAAVVAGAIATPEELRTPEQRRAVSEADHDPQLQHYIDAAADHANEMPGPHATRNDTAASAATDMSVDARADALETFTTAPNLGSAFHTANTASASSAAAAPPMPHAPAATPPRVLTSGFEV